MIDIIQVQELRVSAVADETRDPSDKYGQAGFFSAWADFKTADVRVLGRLKQASAERATVRLKCGPLEVEGTIGKFTWSWGKTRVSVAVDELRFARTVQRSLKSRVEDRLESRE